MQVWLDGSLIDPASAAVRIDDHGLVVGDGAFETLKTVRGEPFAARRHLDRLEHTLDALAIAMPDRDQIRAGMVQVIAAYRNGDAATGELRIRVTVTGGPGPLSSSAPTGPASVIVAASPLGDAPVPSAITVPWTRNERGALAGLKTTSYAENVRALRAAHQAGASEAIMANTVGDLCEGTGTNVFVVIDGQCITPPLSAGPLAGVTRELAIKAMAAHGIKVAERNLPLAVLAEADEVFLTSTTRDVQGLTRVDDRVLHVGPVTTKAAASFDEMLAGPSDP